MAGPQWGQEVRISSACWMLRIFLNYLSLYYKDLIYLCVLVQYFVAIVVEMLGFCCCCLLFFNIYTNDLSWDHKAQTLNKTPLYWRASSQQFNDPPPEIKPCMNDRMFYVFSSYVVKIGHQISKIYVSYLGHWVKRKCCCSKDSGHMISYCTFSVPDLPLWFCQVKGV